MRAAVLDLIQQNPEVAPCLIAADLAVLAHMASLQCRTT